MAYHTPFGAVKIIPASAMRPGSVHFRSPDQPSSSEQPINAAFYAPMGGGIYNAGFVPPGYETGGVIGGDLVDNYSAHYYGGPETTGFGAGGAASGYRGFPQPQPSPQQQPYRRSRTAPPRTLPRSQQNYARYRPRGISADPVDYRYYRSFSGPAKRPTPMYRKKRPGRSSNYQETEFVERPGYYAGATTAPIDPAFVSPTVAATSAHTLRRTADPRLRSYYSPSYTTYPPSTMYPMAYGAPMAHMTEHERRESEKRYINKKYPLAIRVMLKFLQLALGAAILGLVLGPTRNHTFYDFVVRTQTEWQGAVVGIVSVFGILTLLLLLSVCVGWAQDAWRRLDTVINGIGALLYILVAFLESYFAACYPPYGKNHREVCHRAEWIIACILAYFNLIFYIIDFALSMRTGVSVL